MQAPILERVRRRVLAIMAVRGIRAKEVSAVTGISASNLSDVLHGRRGFPVDRLDDVARALRVPTYVLFMDDPWKWQGRRDRRRGERRSGYDRRVTSDVSKMAEAPESAPAEPPGFDFQADRLAMDVLEGSQDGEPPESS